MASTNRRKATAGLLMAVILLLCACETPGTGGNPSATLSPRGIRDPLREGHWRGVVGATMVDFTIDRVSDKEVAIHVAGNVVAQANRSMDAQDNFFYDRPRTCKRNTYGASFDCTRYTDMHIDNGLLCGTYEAPSNTLHICLQPAR
jgi:hypothetical protein